MHYRNTKQKNAVLSTIHKYGHITIEELIDILNKENIKVSLATIYRNLNILSLEGKIKRIQSGKKDYYETIKEDHYHFECSKCHKIVDIEPKNVSIKVNHSIAEVTNTNLYMYGICNQCKNNI